MVSVSTSKRRRNDPDGGDGFLAELVTVGAQIIGSAFGQLGRQIMMSDKCRPGRHGCVAEDVIWMFVRIDHVADRLVGDATNGQQQTLSDVDAAASVDQGDGLLPDNDAEIGDIAAVIGGRQSDLAEMHIVTVSDFLHSKRCLDRGCRNAWTTAPVTKRT